jgi:hypothetical protein
MNAADIVSIIVAVTGLLAGVPAIIIAVKAHGKANDAKQAVTDHTENHAL